MTSVIDKKKLYQRLKILFDTFILTSKTSDYNTILKTATKYFKKFTDSDASVLFLNKNNENLIPVYSIGIPLPRIKNTNIPSFTRLKDIISRPLLDVRYASFMNTPLIQNRKLIGVLAVFSIAPEKFILFEHDKYENLFLSLLASHLAAIIENSTLLKTIGVIENSKNDWENTFDAIDDLISIHDTDFNVIRANKAVANKFNMDIRDIIGKKCYKIFHGTDEPLKTCPDSKTLNTKCVYSVEIEDPHMNGTFSFKSFPHYSESKRLIGSIVIAKDITKQIHENKLLIQSEEKYRLLINNIPDVVWTSDREGNITFISPKVEMIFGYTPKEIYESGNKLWFDRIHHEHKEIVKNAYESLFKFNTKFDVEYKIKRKDGEWIWLHCRAIKTYEKNGIKYADGLFSDITENKYIKDQLAHSERMASLGNMIVWIVHEINNPLSIIKGYVQAFQTEGAGQINQHELSKIRKSTERISLFTRQLLSFAKYNKFDVSLVEPTDAHLILEEALSTFIYKLNMQSIKLIKEYDSHHITINCEANQILQLFINLIVNALDSMESQDIAERILCIKTQIHNNSAIIIIKDTGCGIPDEHINRIFEPFFTTKTADKGTGLGLSICQKIVYDHGGKIKVESQVGKGTTFTVELPMTKVV
ncbi:MAG TPA: ATP-binding protein [Candidatus Wujingus californicus]|uniref:ATP-binding protein n=1 Tax=Candidatus Wujingus californicus TaxID=3367618 RepID=UPI0040264F1C